MKKFLIFSFFIFAAAACGDRLSADQINKMTEDQIKQVTAEQIGKMTPGELQVFNQRGYFFSAEKLRIQRENAYNKTAKENSKL